MLKRIIAGCLTFPRLVLVTAGLLLAYGGVFLAGAEYEVFPEFVPAQASVQTEAVGFSPSQVELLVTRPLENAMNGATGVESVRSQSIQGLSVIDVTFRANEDPYKARQVVAERLSEVAGRLPAGVAAPALSPLTSSTMDLLKIGLVSDVLDPMQLRDLAEWTVRPRLLAVPGVARATLFGGQQRRIEVRVRLIDLAAREMTTTDVINAVQSASDTRGGGFIDNHAQRITIEPRSASLTASDLAQAPMGASSRLRIADVADVVTAATPAFGDALIMGKPGVLISMSSQYGANTLTTTRLVEEAFDGLKGVLDAAGVTYYPRLHRPANFIETALTGIRTDLWLGAALILIVLIALTRDLRVALVALVAIPISLLAALIIVDATGTTINTMTLGGLAVALGVVIDDAVIGVENIVRRLRERTAKSTIDTIVDASVEVRAPVVYATLLLALTMMPVIMLTGLQGAFFAPLAWAFVLAILASLVCAVTVTPALAHELLRRAQPPAEPKLMLAVKHLHERVLVPLCHKPRTAVAITLALGLASIAALVSFGGELLPSFRERHYVLQVNGPSGASIAWMRTLGGRITTDLLAIDGVATVEQQIGRAEAAEDTFAPNRSEFHVELDAVDGAEEDRVLSQIRHVLADYPGVQSEALTFLGDRIGESLSGETASIVIGIFGTDLDVLDGVAARIAAVTAAVTDAVDVQVKSPPGQPNVLVQLDSDRMRAHGVVARNALDVIQAGFQGRTVGQLVDGERVIDVAVTMPWLYPDDPEAIGAMQIRSDDGALVPLSAIAAIDLVDSRALISHEGARRRQVVTANAATSDVAGVAAAIRAAIDADVKLPAGVYLDFAGAAESRSAATNQLLRNSAFALCGVVMLLILAFGGGRPAVLILAGAPSALAGGVIAVALGGGVMSLGALVGFVTLFGIAARNAILLVAHVEQLVADEDASWGLPTILLATRERVTPILATALVTGIGMLPLALATGEAGREVQGPMATVILGGLASSTLFSLLLLPPLILAYQHQRRPGTHTDSRPTQSQSNAHTAH